MGGARTPIDQGHLPTDPGPHWTVIPFNGMPVTDYLQSLDFFVYYPVSYTHLTLPTNREV